MGPAAAYMMETSGRDGTGWCLVSIVFFADGILARGYRGTWVSIELIA